MNTNFNFNFNFLTSYFRNFESDFKNSDFFKGCNELIGTANHRKIGTLYFVLGIFAGIMGITYSIIIRKELSSPDFNIFNFNGQIFSFNGVIFCLFIIFFALNPLSINCQG